MKYLRFIFSILIMVLSLQFISSCLIKKEHPRYLRIDVKDKCESDVYNQDRMVNMQSSYLKLADIRCINDFGVILYIENGVYEDIKRECILQEIIDGTKNYINENPVFDELYSPKKSTMIILLDSVRKYSRFNSNNCIFNPLVRFEYEKFTFDQESIDEEDTRIYLYLRIRQVKKDKLTYVMFFDHSVR